MADSFLYHGDAQIPLRKNQLPAKASPHGSIGKLAGGAPLSNVILSTLHLASTSVDSWAALLNLKRWHGYPML